MSNLSYRTSQSASWSKTRPSRDPSQRYMMHGPILPMAQPGFWQRLFGAR